MGDKGRPGSTCERRLQHGLESHGIREARPRRRGGHSMGDKGRPGPRASDASNTASKATEFEKRALARLGEEAETVVDPAVRRDLRSIPGRQSLDVRLRGQRSPAARHVVGRLPGAVLHLDRKGGRTARTREAVRRIERNGVERLEYPRAGRTHQAPKAVSGSAVGDGGDHGEGSPPGEGGVRAPACAGASMAG